MSEPQKPVVRLSIVGGMFQLRAACAKCAGEHTERHISADDAIKAGNAMLDGVECDSCWSKNPRPSPRRNRA
jgi:hypothetical protein